MSGQCFCQTAHYQPKANYTGWGAYSKNFVDVFSFTSNQAALSDLQVVAAGVYSENRFFLAELNLYSAVIGVPTRLGGFGITAKYFGVSEYNESQMSVAYGKNLGKVSIGVQFNLSIMHIAGYGNGSAVTIEAGTIWHVSEKVYTGFHVANPVGGKFGASRDEKLASQYTWGFGYEASQKVFLSAEIINQEDQPVNVHVGLLYAFAKKFFMRIGITTQSAGPYLGAGLRWKNFRIDVTASHHPQLGITPGILIIFENRKEE